MPTTTAFRLGCMLATAAWAAALAHPAASAQDLCAELDAGMCEEDGGAVDPPGAGAGAGEGGEGGSGGRPPRDPGGLDAGELGVACSCHTDTEAERGARIHLCTESDERDVCRDFDCERGTVRERGCPRDGVRLCCTMRSRGLSTSLYEDCTHPNCESGFREQCREFGGTVSEGACDGASGGAGAGGDGGDDSDGGGFCSAAAPGSGRSGAGALPLVLAALALRLSRRRPARSRPAPGSPPRRA